MEIRYPSKHGEDKKEKELAEWMEDQRESYRNGTLAKERIKKLETLPGWSWEPEGDVPDDEVED